ncbi:hypothetical protein IV500_05830 [Paeniglutamicibacter antarcticus]|uniref:Uncharacterized protein n=1 Tax=Arthrobacter terrae TaxID=2935737 RepID=A0A931G9R0_9MICC|nr:hypothetical protein [Arthrobacter terrae]MBG0738942.1 hypothetical protein [Arthrobacter terrae]
MAAPKTYTVVEADFYDQQEGLKIGVQVEAVPAATADQLLITQIIGADFPLDEPIAVFTKQLAAV